MSASETFLEQFLADPSNRLEFAPVEHPIVSIVLVLWNRADITLQCLAVLTSVIDVPTEIVIVDNGSTDRTGDLIERVGNVSILRNSSNLGFIKACNQGARVARGRYLLLLNNDAMLARNALSRLVSTLETYPEAGAVGAKLVLPDGTLQEAGSIVFDDGSSLGYGRGASPVGAEYNYVREVDYCSAACLMLPLELYRRLGGFDERYGLAYYEDVDLCFAVWGAGKKVVYQPEAIVIHHESSSSSKSRPAEMMLANRPIFAEKWSAELRKRYPPHPSSILRARDRRSDRSILVFEDRVPSVEQGSGYARSLAMIELLVADGWKVTLVIMQVLNLPQEPTRHLRQLGVEIVCGTAPDAGLVKIFLGDRTDLYELAIVCRPHNFAIVGRLLKEMLPHTVIIYDAEALYYRRERLQAEVDGSLNGPRRSEVLAAVERSKRRELALMKPADLVMSVAEVEAKLIREDLDAQGEDKVCVWGFIHPLHAPRTPFGERRDVLFVGSFLQGHPPNVDAVEHFARNILPLVHRQLPDVRFIIVGSAIPPRVLVLSSPHVLVMGYVEDVLEYYEKCKLVVAPIRFGAGIKYKVTEAMSFGIPCVVSPVAADGIDVPNGDGLLIAETDEEFAARVCDAYRDEELWTRLQKGALEYIRRECDPLVMKAKLEAIIAEAMTLAPLRR